MKPILFDSNIHRSESLLYMNSDRVLYVGQLGKPTERVLGSYTIYASCEGSLELSAAAPAHVRREIAIIPPYLPHKISTQDKNILCLMIEPEFLNPDSLPTFLRNDASQHADLLVRMRETYFSKGNSEESSHGNMCNLDAFLNHESWSTKSMDERIERIIYLMRDDPTHLITAPTGAKYCNLSTSRFMHLFKQETGICFRDFRRWKRARNLLAFIKGNKDLTAIALELGYSDSSHFSNSIRYFSGLRPKDIIYGSRKAHLIPLEF